MNRINVGIDVDGVLADFLNGFFKLSREMFGKPPKGYIQAKWNFEEDFESGLTKEMVDKVWQRIKNKETNFWLHLRVLPFTGMLNVLEHDGRFRLFYISSRVPSPGLPLEIQTAAWIEKYHSIQYPTIIIANSSLEKAELSKALKLEYYIDDNLANCQEVKLAIPEGCVAIQNAKYNIVHDDGNLERVYDFNEFCTKLFADANRR